jgi:hypothetical protein
LIVGLIAAFSVVTYVLGTRSVRAGKAVPETMTRRAGRRMIAEVERRKAKRDVALGDGVRHALPPPRRDARPTGNGQS